MAAKKTTSKSASPKGKAKPAVKPSKPAPAAKKTVEKTVGKASSVKKSAPEKKVAPASKSEPVKKSAPLKKAIAAEPAKKPSLPVKPVSAPKAAAVEVKNHKPAKVEVAAKSPVSKNRSSVVDYPVPPAPVKPPFVPPKTASTSTSEHSVAGGNGTHSPAFIQKQRQRLLDLRDELVDAMSGMTRDTIRNAPEGSEASGSGQHQGDAGSDAYDRDFALSVLAKEQDALYEIEQALQRIKKGSYGICEMSSRKIPQARLEAIPFARLTVECQAQWEKEYGNRRFRPSNEVGFSGGKYVEDEDSETVSLDEDED